MVSGVAGSPVSEARLSWRSETARSLRDAGDHENRRTGFARWTRFRDEAPSRYSLRDCYLSAFALCFLQDPSLLQFQRRFQRQLQANNLSTTFGVARIPADSQFRVLLDRHDYQPIRACFADWIGRLCWIPRNFVTGFSE